MAYRTAQHDEPVLAPEAGIVDDMVRQFADPFAFLRELVQNGIDAGATRLEVRVERDDDGTVRTSVGDDGIGMTRAVIEGPLLTLFESSKESDASKIGKYGIGFVSVFATKPRRVEVRTRTVDEAWRLRLFGDHSYELSEDARQDSTGTEVALVHRLEASAFAEHAARATASLARWCRHARVPITLFVRDGAAARDVRVINEPLAVPGVASVTVDDGAERFVVGIGHGADPKLADSAARYYNRGLTLLETNLAPPGLEGLRFAVDSPALAHTLTRDNVRRDREHARVLRRVEEIARDALPKRLASLLARAADEAATGPVSPYLELLGAASAPVLAGAVARVPVPLVEPVLGRTTADLHELGTSRAGIDGKGLVLFAEASTVLTKALAAAGRPVVRHRVAAPLLQRFAPRLRLVDADLACALTQAVAPTGDDTALTRELARLFTVAGREVAGVRFAHFLGARSEASHRVVAAASVAEARSLTSALRGVTDDDERPWGERAVLFLRVDHDHVRLARRHARRDPGRAAQLLCRLVLLEDGPLPARTVDRLLAAAGAPS